MSTDHALAELRQSPLLPDLIADLQATYAAEQRRRERFIADNDASMKAEFINGQVVIHSPARRAHLNVTLQAAVLLRQFVNRHHLGEVLTEKCLIRCQRNDYEPDICFFNAEKTGLLDVNQMIFPPPDLIVEVLSPSTEKTDRTVKFQDYARHGVGEYWIIDADERMVEQYLLPTDGGSYELKGRLAAGGRLASKVIAGFDVLVSALFDAQENQRALAALLSHR